MLRKLTAFALCFGLTLGASALFAQTASLAAAQPGGSSSLLNLDSDNWSLYADEENQLYYVDFATLSVNLNDIIITRDNGEEVLREKVFDLPVDTIYEIDFKPFGPGSYTVELRSFTDVIRRKVSIQE